jgi:hypothetical protein
MRPVTDWSHALIWLLILVSAASLLAFYFYLPRAGGVDEMGLFNPVYMKLHYGRMTYPIHYQPDTMVVHPQLRYAEVAALMSMGMSLFHAESFVFTFLAILILLLVGTGKFQPVVKTGLLFGFLAAVTFNASIHTWSSYGLRPDLQVGAAWFAGLLLLEDGRLRGWDVKRLGLGAFVVTYASGLHYFALAGFLAVIPYGLMAWRSQQPGDAWKTMRWMVLGGCAFGLPYLALFVIPELSAILKTTGEVQSVGDAFTPFSKHFEHYRYWLGLNSLFHFGLTPFEFAYPAFSLSIPLFAVGLLLLLTHRDTRGIAWGSLPLCLFVFAYSRAKSGGYFLPEFLIYFSGVGLILSLGIAMLWRRLLRRHASVAAAATMVCLTVITVTSRNEMLAKTRFDSTVSVSETDVARATARQIVGDEAVVGGRIGLWYVSGATHWYNLEADLLWRPDISGVDLAQYFSAFDYIAEHGHMSNTTVNERLESLPSWIASGVLNVSGFFFSGSHRESNFVLLRPGRRGPLSGYLSNAPSLAKFEESADGSLVFLSMVCGFEAYPADNRFQLEGFTALWLPKPDPNDPSRSILPYASQGNPQYSVVTGILNRKEFALRQDEMRRQCLMLDVIEGDTRPVDREALLAAFRATDRTIHFYRDYDSLIDASAAKAAAPGPVPDLRRIEKTYDKASIEGAGPVRVLTGPEQWSFAAFLPIDFSALPEGKTWVAVKAEITAGTVGFGIYDRDGGGYLSRKFVGAKEARNGDVLLRLEEHDSADGLMIENGAPGGSPSEVTIEQVRILVPPGRSPAAEKQPATETNIADKPAPAPVSF